MKNDINEMVGGGANPYALLNQNFDKKNYDRQINLFDNSDNLSHLNKPKRQPKTSFMSQASHQSVDSGHLSNFTYDKDMQCRLKLTSKLSNLE